MYSYKDRLRAVKLYLKIGRHHLATTGVPQQELAQGLVCRV